MLYIVITAICRRMAAVTSAAVTASRQQRPTSSQHTSSLSPRRSAQSAAIRQLAIHWHYYTVTYYLLVFYTTQMQPMQRGTILCVNKSGEVLTVNNRKFVERDYKVISENF